MEICLPSQRSSVLRERVRIHNLVKQCQPVSLFKFAAEQHNNHICKTKKLIANPSKKPAVSHQLKEQDCQTERQVILNKIFFEHTK